MTYYLKQGNTFKVLPGDSIDIQEELPIGTYTTQVSMSGEIFLAKMDDFSVPSKLYGDTSKQTERVLKTFSRRPFATGAMFTGEKGSGKTLLARNIALEGMKQGYPVIVVTGGLKGDNFNSFIQSIHQPAIVLFDEFEKNYNRDEQEMFLSLFDGTFQTKKLFLFTINDMYKIQDHMKNRPGRIYYMIEFYTLEENFVIEYLEDNLVHKERSAEMLAVSKLFQQFSFDMLQAIVEEVNAYNDTLSEILKIMNVKPQSDSVRYKIDLKLNDKQLVVSDDIFRKSPLASDEIRIWYFDADADENASIIFDNNDLVRFDKETGIFAYVYEDDDEKFELILTPTAPKNIFDINQLNAFM
jgi:hypothetical protein